MSLATYAAERAMVFSLSSAGSFGCCLTCFPCLGSF